MHLRAERREHAHLPVAQLIAEALHHDLTIGWQRVAGGFALLLDVGPQVADGERVERVAGGEHVVVEVFQRAGELAERTAELEGAAELVAMPERHLAGHAGRRGDDDLVGRDVLDAPRGRAEQERLAHATLEHHLLVELAHLRTFGRGDGVEPAVGDGAAAGDRQHASTRAGRELAGEAVPRDAGAQLGELVARVAAAQQIEQTGDDIVGDVGEGVGAASHGGDRIDRGPALVARHHRHDLLAQHIDRVARNPRLLDRTLEHALGHDGGAQQVATELREDAALRRLAHLMSGTADALQSTGHARRRLNLHYEIDSTHVDA